MSQFESRTTASLRDYRNEFSDKVKNALLGKSNEEIESLFKEMGDFAAKNSNDRY